MSNLIITHPDKYSAQRDGEDSLEIVLVLIRG